MTAKGRRIIKLLKEFYHEFSGIYEYIDPAFQELEDKIVKEACDEKKEKEKTQENSGRIS